MGTLTIDKDPDEMPQNVDFIRVCIVRLRLNRFSVKEIY